MYQGNWKCSSCGGAITQLPFEPRSESGLTCRDCFMNKKRGEQATAPVPDTSAPPLDDAPPFDPELGEVAGEPAPPPPDEPGTEPAVAGERKLFQGEWECSQCGGAITQLPFQPRDTSGLKCLDCFKASR